MHEELKRLHKENKELRDELHAKNERINRMIVKYRTLKDENNRLANLLDLPTNSQADADMPDFMKDLFR